jgi:hypothetical protein
MWNFLWLEARAEDQQANLYSMREPRSSIFVWWMQLQRQRPPAVSPWVPVPPILVRKHDVSPHIAFDGEGTWIMYWVHELPSK